MTKNALKNHINNNCVYSLIMDETPDDLQAECVVNILYTNDTCAKPILLDTKYFNRNVNHRDIIGIFNDSREYYGLRRELCICFITDNASYMNLAFQHLQPLYLNSIHIIDPCHKLHNTISDLMKHKALKGIITFIHTRQRFFLIQF